MAQSITAAPVAPPRRRRRFLFPLLLVCILLAGFFAWPIGKRLEVEPEKLMQVVMIGQWAAMASFVVLLIWFLVFSGFRWYTRVLGLLFVALLAGAAAAAIRKVEVSGDMEPMAVYFRWQPDPDADLTAAMAPWTKSADLPPINLAIDPIFDFPRYRGLNGDGVVTGRVMATDWNSKPPALLWKHRCGGGYAGFAVAGNVAITIEQRQDKEAVVCWDRTTGKQRWVYEYPDLFTRSEFMGGDGPRATPTIDNGDVFSVGANGRFVCLDGASGKKKWGRDILADSGAKNIDWAMSGSPLIVGSLVIVNPGIDKDNNVGKALAAYERASGEPVWQSGNSPAGYSSPQLATVAGLEQVLLFDAGGLAGHDVKTGKELWRHPWTTMMGMNIIQPLVLGGDRILIGSDPSGCGVVQVRCNGDQFTVEEVWKNRRQVMKFSNPVVANGHIYGLSGGKLVCLDPNDGKVLWKGDDYGSGQLLLVGDLLVVTGEHGEVALVAAKSDGFQELARMDALAGKTWNTPALAGNQLFLRNHKEMACYELPTK
jgi:outer membrane protein assembly factor BamB